MCTRVLLPFEPKSTQISIQHPRSWRITPAAHPCWPQVPRCPRPSSLWVSSPPERPGASDSLPRFVPRHADELELEVDDPLLVEVQAEDYWYEAYNMRTGDRGIFPAYYAIEVTKDPDHITGTEPL